MYAAPVIEPILAIVIVSFNRRDALLRTLAGLHAQTLRGLPLPECCECVVVDNASTDGSADEAEAFALARWPALRVVRNATNRAISAFNQGVRATTAPMLLILDDDAMPEEGSLERAFDLIDARAAAALALVPTHPRTGLCEWPFITSQGGVIERFPIMGCGNLVRREIWERAGGYCEAYFLYRNDTDLACTLLGLGENVLCDPALRVLHDSPVATRKSERWLRLATRNAMWMARRHGRGLDKMWAISAFAGKAIMEAGLSPARLARVLCGAMAGILRAAPALPPAQLGSAHTGIGMRRYREVRSGRDPLTAPSARPSSRVR